jgi:hypothetical protein
MCLAIVGHGLLAHLVLPGGDALGARGVGGSDSTVGSSSTTISGAISLVHPLANPDHDGSSSPESVMHAKTAGMCTASME